MRAAAGSQKSRLCDVARVRSRVSVEPDSLHRHGGVHRNRLWPARASSAQVTCTKRSAPARNVDCGPPISSGFDLLVTSRKDRDSGRPTVPIAPQILDYGVRPVGWRSTLCSKKKSRTTKKR